MPRSAPLDLRADTPFGSGTDARALCDATTHGSNGSTVRVYTNVALDEVVCALEATRSQQRERDPNALPSCSDHERIGAGFGARARPNERSVERLQITLF